MFFFLLYLKQKKSVWFYNIFFYSQIFSRRQPWALYKSICPYGRKSVDRIANQSMSKICNLCCLIVVDCDYAEIYRWFLSGGDFESQIFRDSESLGKSKKKKWSQI